jgi:hypothetical protein
VSSLGWSVVSGCLMSTLAPVASITLVLPERMFGRPGAEEMIHRLVLGQEAVVRTARSFSPWSKKLTTSRPPISSPSGCRSTRRPPGCRAASWPELELERELKRTGGAHPLSGDPGLRLCLNQKIV